MAADGAKQPNRNRDFDFRDLQWSSLTVLRLWFALGNAFRAMGPGRSPAQRPAAPVLLLKPPAAAFIGAFLGCLATLYLSAFGIVPAIASALATTLLCGQVLLARVSGRLPAEFFVAVYGGSFGGMTPVLGLFESAPDRSLMLVSPLFMMFSMVCGLAFCIVAAIDVSSTRRIALGYGGRSGAVATAASFLALQGASLLGVDDRLFRPAETFDLDPAAAALTCAACMLGLFATMTVLRRQGVVTVSQADRTFLASAVALTGLVTLHLLDPNDGRTLEAFYAGCFLGMSTPERLKGWFQPVLGALVLTLTLIATRALLPGVGGALGFAAFLTVTVLVGLAAIASRGGRRIGRPRRASADLTSRNARASGRAGLRQSWRAAGGIAHPIAAGLAFCALVALHRFALPEPVLETEAMVQSIGPPLAISGPAVQGEARPRGTDDAMASMMPPASTGGIDLGMAMDLPAGAAMMEHGLPDGSERSSPGRAAVLAAVNSVKNPVGLNEAASEAWRAGHAADLPAPVDARDTALRTISAGAEPEAAAPARSTTPTPDGDEADEKLFREFLHWRAAHAGVAQAGVQPARRSRPPRPSQIIGLLTPAAPTQPRPVRPDRARPATAQEVAAAPLTARPSTPRTPAPNGATASAHRQPVP